MRTISLFHLIAMNIDLHVDFNKPNISNDFIRKWCCGGSFAVLSKFFLFGWGAEMNQVHYYCGHLLACCTSPRWWVVIVVEQLVEWMIGKGNRSTQRKHVPVPLCPPQIPHDLTQAGTQFAAVGSRPATPVVCDRCWGWMSRGWVKWGKWREGGRKCCDLSSL
jgi:hypothetical protein